MVTGCPNLTDGGPCDAHRKTHGKDAGKVKNRIYDSARWRRFRLWFLARHPLCEMDCKTAGLVTPANEVDHILEIAKGGELLDEKNCRSACKPCHSRRSAEASSWSRKTA
jgi:5-methylcytosine-specific restriction protein A